MAASNAEGQPFAGDYIFGKHGLLVYAAPNASRRMPSGGYIFTWSLFGNKFGARMTQFPMRHLNNAQRIEGDMLALLLAVKPDAKLGAGGH